MVAVHLDAHTDSYGYDPNAKYNATTQFTPRAPKPPPTSFTGGEMNSPRSTPPRQLLRVVDLAQIQHVPLHHAPPGGPRVLDNAPIAMLLAILPANFAAQEHDGRRLSALAAGQCWQTRISGNSTWCSVGRSIGSAARVHLSGSRRLRDEGGKRRLNAVGAQMPQTLPCRRR